MKHTIDLNSDLGEGAGYDHLIMPHISSCNIACGGHTGNKESIKEVLKLAKKFNVKAGAHPSFEDSLNFGRVRLDWSRVRFRESVTQQLNRFKATADSLDVKLHHIKMHGALYHATANEEQMSNWTVEWLQENFSKTPIYGPPNSLLQEKCISLGQPFLAEAFADRAYEANGQLKSRSLPNSLWTNVDQVFDQLIEMVKHKTVTTSDGNSAAIEAHTYCIHGDNPGLIKKLPELMKQLKKEKVYVQ